MKKALQHWGWISGTRQRTVNTALALAVLIAPTVVVTQSVQAQSFSVLFNFNYADGTSPVGGLVRDKEGNLYGASTYGGAFSQGTVFKLDTMGTETVLHNFIGPDGSDPDGGLVLDKEGNLYGTTSGGGSSNNGTVFKLDPTGTETVLYSFTGLADGAFPFAGLVRDKEGNLYGATNGGGLLTDCFVSYGCGVVFKVDTAGVETVLHNFTGPDGTNPNAGLVRDKAGNLYGATSGGGAASQGTVFKVDARGAETVLHSFTGPDGSDPDGVLVLDKEGNLYGTTFFGGLLFHCLALRCGLVFKLNERGTETILYSFTGGADGANPYAGLVQDKAGNLYGATSSGGASSQGTVFKLTPDAPHRVR
jgi:uncharacterized repeat protein (TIGR03803 family)